MWLFLAFVNVVLAFIAENYYRTSKITTIIYLGAIVIINTFFIGLRDFGVGTDTIVYIEDYFIYAGHIDDFDTFLSDDQFDKGYVALAYIANIFSDSKQSLLVITEFFITSFIVLGIYEYKKGLGISFAGFFALFWLLYQQETINLMRQFCAMSLLFYGFAKLINKKYLLYCLLQIVAFFFHSTSILFLVVPLGLFLCKIESKWKYLILILPVWGAFYVYNNYFELLHYLGDLNLVDEVLVDRYGEQSVYSASKGNVSYKFLIPAFLIFLVYKFKLLNPQKRYMLLFLLISTFLLEQSKFISQYFFRMSYYPGIIFIVYFSEVYKSIYWGKCFYIQSLCILALFYYGYQNYTYMYSATVGFVYRSAILGIN